MAKKRLELVDMQERLREDAGGLYKQEVLGKLEAFGAELKSKLDAGMPPEEFNRLSSLKTAVDDAIITVNRAWAVYHRQP